MSTTQNIDQLLELNDAIFVEGAYQALLGRAPDLEGMRYYLDRLRAGHAKAEIIAQIAASPETRSRGTDLPGLREVASTYKKTRFWLWGIFGRSSRIERQTHRLENEFGRIAQQVADQQTDAANRLDRIKNGLVEQQSDAAVRLYHIEHGLEALQSDAATRLDRMQHGLVEQQSDVATRLDRIKNGLVEQQSDAAVRLYHIEHGLEALQSDAAARLDRLEQGLAALQASVHEISVSLTAKAEESAPASPAQPAAIDLSGLSQRARHLLAGMAQAATRSAYGSAA